MSFSGWINKRVYNFAYNFVLMEYSLDIATGLSQGLRFVWSVQSLHQASLNRKWYIFVYRLLAIAIKTCRYQLNKGQILRPLQSRLLFMGERGQ